MFWPVSFLPGDRSRPVLEAPAVASVLAPSPRILRDLLAAKGSWSQSDVASRSGLSRAMVSTLFNGGRQWVSWSTRQAVADAFSVLTAELYDDYAPDKEIGRAHV